MVSIYHPVIHNTVHPNKHNEVRCMVPALLLGRVFGHFNWQRCFSEGHEKQGATRELVQKHSLLQKELGLVHKTFKDMSHSFGYTGCDMWNWSHLNMSE